MYMRVWDMVKIANDPTETRPLILCEYDFVVLHQQHNMAGIHMQWETVMGIYIYIGKQLTTLLDSKEALFGIGLIK